MDDEELQLGNEQLLNLKTELEAMDDRLMDESCMNLNLESTNGHGMYMEEEETDDGNMIIMHLDIRESLSTMKAILQEKLSMDFSDFEIWLQDMQQLEPDKNLVDQCVQGEGLVQINIELKKVDGVRRINIVDVLKPQEDCLETPPVETTPKVAKPPVPIIPKPKENLPPVQQPQPKPLPKILPSENVTRWVMDAQFRKDQERLNIPFDPVQWSEAHVRHWLQWAVRQFRLRGIQLSQWNIKGSQLCTLSLQDFRARVPHDENDLFWTHLELLKKCKFVGVIQKSKPIIQFVTTPLSVNDAKTIKRAPKPITVRPSEVQLNPAHNKSGFNGQVQLWQFLLELLTDWTYRSVIGWIGTEGEFKLHNPELVAHLWGERKNKPNMNYEKLSRALRYYYDGDMISKVPAKRFTYKFVCNLQELLGYSAVELHEQVVDCERRAVARSCTLR